MKNLIYQNWSGNLTSEARASRDNIKAYAERIGAAYRFDQDPSIARRTFSRRAVPKAAHYYECLNMLVDDSFLEYDNVLALDMDVFAVDGLAESIFDIPFGDLGICSEPAQPKIRAANPNYLIGRRNDEKWGKAIGEKWGIDLPRTDEGLIKVYNAGVVLFSRQGILKARERFVPFADYVATMRKVGWLRWRKAPHAIRKLPRFYWLDQHYLHAMMLHANLDWTELHNGWNSLLQHAPDGSMIDERTAETRLVHVQIRGAGSYDTDTLWRITNLPQAEWGV